MLKNLSNYHNGKMLKRKFPGTLHIAAVPSVICIRQLIRLN